MNLFRLVCAVVALFGLVTAGFADEKGDANKQKLIGKWETSKGGIKIGMELLKSGKVKLAVTIDGQSQTMDGTYQVEGDKVTMTLNQDGKEKKSVATILTLTDTKLVVEDERKRKDEYKRIK